MNSRANGGEVCDELYRVTLGGVTLPKAMLVPSANADELVTVPLSSLIIHSPYGWFMCDLGRHPSFRQRGVLPALPGPATR